MFKAVYDLWRRLLESNPRKIYAFLNFVTSANFVSSILWVNTVVEKFSQYDGPPYNNLDRQVNQLNWRKVPHGNSSFLLGLPLPKNGNVLIGLEGNCFPRDISSRMNYDSESDICINIREVFSYPISRRSTYRNIVCPGYTGVYDDDSYVITNGDGGRRVNLIPYYVPNWQAKARSLSSCKAISAIYIATLVFFCFECLLFANLIYQSFDLIRNNAPNSEESIKGKMELPFFGVIYALYYISDVNAKRYIKIDDVQNKNQNVIPRLIGLHRSSNLLYRRVQVPSFFFTLGISPQNENTKRVYLWEALAYPLCRPFAKTNLFLPMISNIAPGIAQAFGVSFWACFIYSDHVYLYRILVDIPSVVLAFVYLYEVENTPFAFVSAAFSLALLAYYMGTMIMGLIYDHHTNRMFIHRSADNLADIYGDLSENSDFLITLFVPWLQVTCWLVITPYSLYYSEKPEQVMEAGI